MHGRWTLAGVVLLALAACSGGESEWVQTCVLNGKTRAQCVCLDKELKPEWRDMALMSDAARTQVQPNMAPDTFAGLSTATSKCMAAN